MVYGEIIQLLDRRTFGKPNYVASQKFLLCSIHSFEPLFRGITVGSNLMEEFESLIRLIEIIAGFNKRCTLITKQATKSSKG
jgi:hypothetical protein